MATMNVLDAAGSSTAIEKPLAPGRAAASASKPVTLCNEDFAVIDGLETKLDTLATLLTTQAGYLDGIEGLLTAIRDTSAEYETVAASQTDQVLGATGAVGDVLSSLLIIPATTAAGAVSVKDGNGSSITLFAGGGTTPLSNLVPFTVSLGAAAVNATTPGWKVTTGANVSVIGFGNFT